jgi:hypothetical protein
MASGSEDDEPKVGLGAGYAWTQWLKALRSTGATAKARAAKWSEVLAGMASGALQIGSRTPVDAYPAWVTLDVLHGGFATGQRAAGGPLQPHELSKLALIGDEREPAPHSRLRLNAYGLSQEGVNELAELLRSGCFRATVPEETALLVNAWLRARDETERSTALLHAITPFFEELRFYPEPRAQAEAEAHGVSVQTVGDVVTTLRNKSTRPAVAAMREAVTVWAPLYDETVAIVLETVDQNGEPFRQLAQDWALRAQQLLDRYAALRTRHRLCNKPDDPHENFWQLRQYVSRSVSGAVSERDRRRARQITDAYVAKRGAPGSDKLVAARHTQHAHAARPTHKEIAQVIEARLAHYAADSGCAEIDEVLRPLSDDELAGCSGALPPAALAAKVVRCMQGSPAQLVARGAVQSSEVLAELLPELSGRAIAAALEDPAIRRVYWATYTAFRKRRSLLLVDLQSQAKLRELPWIAALEPWLEGNAASAQQAHSVLTSVAVLAIRTFPQTQPPNKLVKELRSLAVAAKIELPLVEELAADIFMNAFSVIFLRSAQAAAELLQGSLYERYFGIDYAYVRTLDDVAQRKSKHAAAVSPGFAALCNSMTGPRHAAGAARNGQVIEQAQIITTHNLAALWSRLDLKRELHAELPMLARRCFEWICQRQRRTISKPHARLRNFKNCAYAWRQLVFYLSLANPNDVTAFLTWMDKRLASEPAHVRATLEPFTRGLRFIHEGGRFESTGTAACRRWLGWAPLPK